MGSASATATPLNDNNLQVSLTAWKIVFVSEVQFGLLRRQKCNPSVGNIERISRTDRHIAMSN